MRRTLRFSVPLALLVLLVGTPGRAEDEGTTAKPKADDAERHPTTPIVWVNNEPILYQEVLDRVGAALRRLGNPDPRVRLQLEDDTVIELITQRLILDAAKRMRLVLNGRALDEEIGRERERIQRGGQTFDSYLDERGITLEGFRRMVEQKFTIEAFMTGQLGLRRSLSALDRPEFDTGVTPREAREWHRRHRERFKRPADVRLSTITIAVKSFLSIGGGVTTNEAVEKAAAAAAEVQAKLDAGEPFEDVAREYSHDNYKGAGGDNGRQTLDALAPGLLEPVAETPVGSIGTAVLRRRLGMGTERIVQYVIFRVDERREARIAPFSDPETQKQVFLELRQEKLRRVQSKIVMTLAGDATIVPERYHEMLLDRHRRELTGK